MRLHIVRRWGSFLALGALGATAGYSWAQAEQIASRIEALSATQQRQLQALIATRQEQDDARLFTDEEVRAVRAAIPVDADPLPRADVERLSLNVHRLFGRRGNFIHRVVTDDPAFPICTSCDGGIDKTCHKPSSEKRRVQASSFIEQNRHLAEAVGALYLVRPGGAPMLTGTAFVLQGRIVTNVHVMLDATQSTGGDMRKLKAGHQIVVAFGSEGARRLTLPAEATWHRHANQDLILTAWPAGVPAPRGLTVATGSLAPNTPIALLGFPTVNTNTDRPEDIDHVYGRCPDQPSVEPRMVISMGHIALVLGAALEHNANSMGNSSGSPLFRLSDGALVAVHRGDALSSDRNSAVGASALAELLTASAP